MIKILFSCFWDGYNTSSSFICKELTRRRISFRIVDCDPDIVIFSCFGHFDRAKYPTARRFIFYSAECVFDNAHADLVIGFHPTTEGRFIRLTNFERNEIEVFNNASIYRSLVCNALRARKKDYFCAFVVSNPGCWQRNTFFEMLSRYKFVDSFGKFRKNVTYNVPSRKTSEYIKFLSRFKFVICFENCSHLYYTTEKLYNCFKAGTVPIYWGDSDALVQFSPQSMVFVPSSGSRREQEDYFRKAILEIEWLDNDNKLYLDILNQKCVEFAEEKDEFVKMNLDIICQCIAQ